MSDFRVPTMILACALRRLGRAKVALLGATALVAAPVDAQLTTLVVPQGSAEVESSSGNRYPFGDSIPRYQQAFGSSDLLPILGAQIQEIAFRLDDGSHVPQPGFQYGNIRLRLSTKSSLLDALQLNFDDNLGEDVAVVYDGPFTLPAMTGGPGPNPFDFRFVLTTPFAYTGGDLLLDVEIEGFYSGTHWYLDAPDTTSDSVSRGWVKGTGSFTDSQAFVVEFRTIGGESMVEPMVDCGGNLATLTHVTGQPALGGAMKIEMDDAQSIGAVAFLAFAIHPPPGWPPCGLTLPGVGELLLDPASPTPVMLLGGGATWAGVPLMFSFPIPDDVSLITVEVYAQGLWVDGVGAAPGEPLRLTGGIAMEIGL